MANPFLRVARWFREHRLFQVYAIYFAASWLVLQVAAIFISNFGLPQWFFPAAVLLLLIGLVLLTATAMAQRAAAAQATPPTVESIAASLKAGRLPALTWQRAILGGVVAFALWGAAAAAFILLRGVGGEGGEGGEKVEEAGAASPAVAVLPFRSVGSGLELWREGMVDLLSTNLDGAGDLRAIDPRAVLSRWRDRIGAGKDPRDSRDALEVARDLKARYAVLGSIVALGDRVRVVADLYEVGGARRVEAQVDGPQDSVFALVDEITVDVLAGAFQAGPQRDVRLEAFTTSSLPALKAYLRGEQLFRGGRWNDAIAEYAQAVSLDSTFAMAHWRMSGAYGWVPDFDAAARAADLAVRHADRLPERQRLKLLADRALTAGRFSAVDMFRRLTERYPDDVDAWYNLGEAIWHFGFLENLPQSASLDAFARAVALDSTYLQALVHSFNFFLARGDSVQAHRYLELSLAIDPASPHSVGFRIAYSLVFGDPRESDWIAAALDTASADALQEASLALNGVAADESRLAVARAAAAPRHPKARRAVAHALHLRWWLIWHGQARAAQEELQAAEALGPGPPLASLYVFDYLTGYGDSALAARAAVKLQRQPEPVARWLLGALAIRWARYSEVDRQLVALQGIGDSARTAGDTVAAERALGLRQALEGFLVGSRGDVSRAAESLAQAGPRMGGFGPYLMLAFVTLYHRLALAEMLENLGKETEALEIYRVFSENVWQWHFGVPAALAAARIEERRGEREQAITHYAHVVKMWERADPQFQPQVEEARRALQRLAGERASDD
ncbi:MAG: hypothetical protein HY702_04685 [Gemmatimonadetes bacterium]|nr:hypothetical protein [Gemmatimonadota bacterium]